MPETWGVLQASRNLAALATLGSGLTSSNPNVRCLSLKSLLARGDEKAFDVLVSNWEHLQEEDLELFESVPVGLAEAAFRLLQSGDLSRKRAALLAIESLDLTQSIDELLKIMVNRRHALCAQATKSVAEICYRWGAAGRNNAEDSAIRKHLVERVYSYIVRFHEHKNLLVLDAWLDLASWEDRAQKGFITDPRMDAYRPMLKRFEESDSPRVMQLLGGYLWRSTTPQSVLDILIQKENPEFVVEIASQLSDETLPLALKRLREIKPLRSLDAWAENPTEQCFEVESRLWLMLSASSENLPRVFFGAKKMASVASNEGRSTASQIILRARRPDLDELVPLLQASEASMEGDNFKALALEIANWKHSPSKLLQRASREYFRDFSISNLLEMAKRWPAEMSRTMADLVKVVDENFTEVLAKELQSPSPKRRMVALQVTEFVGCAADLKDQVIELLNDPRVEVRVRAIDLISTVKCEELETIIPRLLADVSTDIQDAASRALRRLDKRTQIST